MESLSESVLAALIGLAGGVLLGLAAACGRFCTLGAIEDAIYARDTRRARMWGVALAVAVLGVFSLESLGAIDLSASVYARQTWNPLASVVGGLLFGYGMAMAGNCGYGALARAAGGEIRSLVVVVIMGVSAYLVLAGPLSSLRVALFPVETIDPTGAPSGIAHFFSASTGLSPLSVAAAAALLFSLWAFASAPFRAAPQLWFWGAVVGVSITLGWAGTSWVAATGFDATPVESHSFTAPLGETILYLMTASAGGVGFSVGSVAGVLLGALAGSLALGRFRWDACDDPRELGRQVLGAALMGIGGVIAVGCSVGQGLTAFSTLAWSAPVVAASIVFGATLGLGQLIEGGFGRTFRWLTRPRNTAG